MFFDNIFKSDGPTSQRSPLSFKMHVLFTLALQGLAATIVNAQRDPNSGCPPVLKEQPTLVRPKNCPDPKTVPKGIGSIRDNECIVAGIVGVCRDPPLNMISVLINLRVTFSTTAIRQI
jgi:hypothetical protein